MSLRVLGITQKPGTAFGVEPDGYVLWLRRSDYGSLRLGGLKERFSLYSDNGEYPDGVPIKGTVTEIFIEEEDRSFVGLTPVITFTAPPHWSLAVNSSTNGIPCLDLPPRSSSRLEVPTRAQVSNRSVTLFFCEHPPMAVHELRWGDMRFFVNQVGELEGVTYAGLSDRDLENLARTEQAS